jgi:hypothetical protein
VQEFIATFLARRKFTTQHSAQKGAKDIEEAIAEFTNVLQKAAWNATPDDKLRTKYPEYAWEVKGQIKENENSEKDDRRVNILKIKRWYTEVARKLKDQIKRIKEETFQTHIQSLTATADTNYSLWKATRLLKQPTQRIPPIRNADQTWVRSDKEKANTFAGHLEKTFKPNELPQNEDLETERNKLLR